MASLGGIPDRAASSALVLLFAYLIYWGFLILGFSNGPFTICLSSSSLTPTLERKKARPTVIEYANQAFQRGFPLQFSIHRAKIGSDLEGRSIY